LPGAGPAGLRGLLKSPPRRAGQSPANLAGNPAQSLPQAPSINIGFNPLGPNCSKGWHSKPLPR